jgi:hypothetical protein
MSGIVRPLASADDIFSAMALTVPFADPPEAGTY